MPKNGPSEAQVTDQPSTLSPPGQVTMHDPSAIAGGAGCCTVAHAQSTSSRPLTQDFEKIKRLITRLQKILPKMYSCFCETLSDDLFFLPLFSRELA